MNSHPIFFFFLYVKLDARHVIKLVHRIGSISSPDARPEQGKYCVCYPETFVNEKGEMDY